MQKKLTALFLRGASMGSKFLLMIGLSKVLKISDYGEFSLIVTTITFFIFLVGFDFYNFSHREIINNDTKKLQFIFNQFVFHTISYVIFIPIIYFTFLKGIISFNYFFLFYILLILEHLGQEMFRLLNLFNKPNIANFTLFFRTALWIILLVILHTLNVIKININAILKFWIFGSLFSLIFGLAYFILKSSSNLSTLKNVIYLDKHWLKQGLIISYPFFLGTIAYKIIEYSDRYLIDWFLGKQQVGIYFFYSNIANMVNIVINTITITLLVPNLLRVISTNIKTDVKAYINKFSRELKLTTIVVSVFVALFIYPILLWVDKISFKSDLAVFFVIIIGNVFLNISLLYHFLLYGYSKDKEILKPALIAASLNIVLNIIFIPIFGIIAAGLSTLLSFMLILILKRNYWNTFKASILNE